MSRRRPGAGATISLFPFLAVLLCTMGALLVLLVIFSRRARESETAAARAAEQSQAEELELAREEFRWRLEQLREVRDRTADDLARERMRLAGVEEVSRTLADELDALERTAAALERDASGPSAIDAEAVTAAERRLAAARAALDATRAEGAEKPAAYAVVPYEGSGGTHRRPLYVECCIDGVFLQPEGLRLGPADFEGPPGPGNPLASALRAAREHLARGPAEAGDPASQPYPLLLVRPSGVMAYYAAREALTSWGSEFGYQFIDEDWHLAYPPADPALADVERRAIEESRRRLEWLAQVRPARPARPTQQYRASTTRGGVVADGGPSVLGDQSRFDWTEEQANAAGGTGGGRGTGDGGGNAGDSTGGGVGGGDSGGDVVLGGRAGANTGAAGRYAGPSRFYAGQPPAAAANGTGGPLAAGADAGAAGAGGPASASTSGNGGSTSSGSGVGAPGGRGSPATDGGGLARGAASAGGLGGGGAGSTGAGGAAGGSAGSAGMGGGGGSSLPGMMQAGAAASCQAGGSLAGSRGSNWASLATAERPIPLTRPIRVECAANEFRIFDDSGARVETRIPIGTRTADSIDPLVQAVHGRVGRWGLAGERMYWRPELVLSEAGDGRSRREDLERLLADSGLDTRHDAADAEVRRLPPVTRTSGLTPRR